MDFSAWDNVPFPFDADFSALAPQQALTPPRALAAAGVASELERAYSAAGGYWDSLSASSSSTSSSSSSDTFVPHQSITEVFPDLPPETVFERRGAHFGPLPALHNGEGERGPDVPAARCNYMRCTESAITREPVYKYFLLSDEQQRQIAGYFNVLKQSHDNGPGGQHQDVAQNLVARSMCGVSELVRSESSRFFLDFDMRPPAMFDLEQFFPALVSFVHACRAALRGHDTWCVVLRNALPAKQHKLHVVFPATVVTVNERAQLMDRVHEYCKHSGGYVPDPQALHSLRVPYSPKIFDGSVPTDYYYPWKVADRRRFAVQISPTLDVNAVRGDQLLIRLPPKPAAAATVPRSPGLELAVATAPTEQVFETEQVLARWGDRIREGGITVEEAEQLGLIDYLNQCWAISMFNGPTEYWVRYMDERGRLRWTSKQKKEQFMDMVPIWVMWRQSDTERKDNADADDDDEEDTGSPQPATRKRGKYNVRPKQIPLAQLWLRSRHRREVNRVVYDPFPLGHPLHMDSQMVLNLFEFSMFGQQDELPGVSIDPFLVWLYLLFEQNLLSVYFWLGFMAAVWVRPYEKLCFLPSLVSRFQGIGKSSLVKVLQQLFKENAVCVSDSATLQGFNTLLGGKLLLCLEEMDLRQDRETVKHLTTGETININTKFQNSRVDQNVLNICHTANDLNYVPTVPGERRFYVIECLPPFGARGRYDKLMYQYLHGKSGPDPTTPLQIAAELRQLHPVFERNGFGVGMVLPKTEANMRAAAMNQTSMENYVGMLMAEATNLLGYQQKAILEHPTYKSLQNYVRARPACEVTYNDSATEDGQQFTIGGQVVDSTDRDRKQDDHPIEKRRLWFAVVPTQLQYLDYTRYCEQYESQRVKVPQNQFNALLMKMGVKDTRRTGESRAFAWPLPPVIAAYFRTTGLSWSGKLDVGTNDDQFSAWAARDPLNFRRFSARGRDYLTAFLDSRTPSERGNVPYFDNWVETFTSAF